MTTTPESSTARQRLGLVLARAVVRSPGFAAVLESAGAPPKDVADLADQALKRLPKGGGVAYVSPRLVDLLDRAEREAKRDHVEHVGIGHGPWAPS